MTDELTTIYNAISINTNIINEFMKNQDFAALRLR